MTKEPLFKRPLFAIACAFFGAGILAGTAGMKYGLPLCALLAVGCLAALAAGTVLKKRRAIAVLVLLCAALASFALQLVGAERKILQCERLDGVSAEAVLTVTEVRYSSSYYGYYTARLTDSEAFPDMKVALEYSDGSCRVGDVLRGEVTLVAFESSGAFDEAAYNIPDGILIGAHAESLRYVGHEEDSSVTGVLSRLNRRLCARITAASGSGSLARAVLLGQRDGLGRAVLRDFSRIGISHLLALSGLHLSVLVAALESALSNFLSPRVRSPLKAAAVLFFMALVGFGRSVTRAGIMHIFCATAQLLRRDSDSRTSLAVSAMLIMLADPFAVRDAAFLLSVLAAYACIAYSEYVGRADRARVSPVRRLLRSAADTVRLSLLISALTLPVMWSVFGEISLISPLTNVVFIPTLTLFLYFSIMYLALCTTPLCAVLTPLLNGGERAIFALARRISALPHITLSVRSTLVGVCSLALFFALFAVSLHPRRIRRCDRVALTVCSALLVLTLAAGELATLSSAREIYITRGKSEGFAVRCGALSVLIDVSDGSSGFSRELLAAAEEEGATEIGCLVLTHLHRRHISSVASLAESCVLRSVCLPRAENDADEAVSQTLISYFEREGIPYTEYSRDGDTLTVGSIRFEALGYCLLSRSSHPTIVFSLSFAGRELLYLGSSFEEGAEYTEVPTEADTVFFGRHPPKRKRDVSLELDGRTAVFSHGVTEDGLLRVDGAEREYYLGEDGVFRDRKVKIK